MLSVYLISYKMGGMFPCFNITRGIGSSSFVLQMVPYSIFIFLLALQNLQVTYKNRERHVVFSSFHRNNRSELISIDNKRFYFLSVVKLYTCLFFVTYRLFLYIFGVHSVFFFKCYT